MSLTGFGCCGDGTEPAPGWGFVFGGRKVVGWCAGTPTAAAIAGGAGNGAAEASGAALVVSTGAGATTGAGLAWAVG
jgi:hypothetical protein